MVNISNVDSNLPLWHISAEAIKKKKKSNDGNQEINKPHRTALSISPARFIHAAESPSFECLIPMIITINNNDNNQRKNAAKVDE